MITVHLALSSALLLGALTPAKVSNVDTNSSAAPAKAPSVIYVDRFTVSDTVANSSSGGLLANRPHLLGHLRGDDDADNDSGGILAQRRQEQHGETLDKLPGLLQRALVENLNKSIAPAAAGDGDGGSSHGWVIRGEFVTVDSGNRALKAGVGFGAGQSQVEVNARVYTLTNSDTAFLVFNSKGASGHMPGAVIMMNPYVAAAKFVMSKKDPEKETKKIAKAIADEIGKFMTAQGIPKKTD